MSGESHEAGKRSARIFENFPQFLRNARSALTIKAVCRILLGTSVGERTSCTHSSYVDRTSWFGNQDWTSGDRDRSPTTSRRCQDRQSCVRRHQPTRLVYICRYVCTGRCQAGSFTNPALCRRGRYVFSRRVCSRDRGALRACQGSCTKVCCLGAGAGPSPMRMCGAGRTKKREMRLTCSA